MKAEKLNNNIWVPNPANLPVRIDKEPDWQKRKQISVTLDPAARIGSDKNFQPSKQ